MECYSYICRKLLGRTNYKRWNDFDWDDYLERKRLRETFMARHLPLLTGAIELTDAELKPPDEWSVPTTATTPRSKSVTDKAVVARRKMKVSCPSRPKMMFDFEKELWVENTMGSQAPSGFSPFKGEKSKKSKRKRKGKKGKRAVQPKKKRTAKKKR